MRYSWEIIFLLFGLLGAVAAEDHEPTEITIDKEDVFSFTGEEGL